MSSPPASPIAMPAARPPACTSGRPATLSRGDEVSPHERATPPTPCRSGAAHHPTASTLSTVGTFTLALPSAGLRLPSETTASCCAHTHTKPTAQRQPRCAGQTAPRCGAGHWSQRPGHLPEERATRNADAALCDNRASICAHTRRRQRRNGGGGAARGRQRLRCAAQPSRDIRHIPQRAPGCVPHSTQRCDARCVRSHSHTNRRCATQTQRTPREAIGHCAVADGLPARGRG